MCPALAIFARTPHRSAAKTRLAEQTSRSEAELLYEFSLRCTAEIGRELLECGWKVNWAVAEAGGENDEYWRQTGIAAVSSGSGELGSRLAFIYAWLLEQADVAMMIGSDSPQLPALRLQQAAELALQNRFVAGPAVDGGFYVFAGTEPIANDIWESVSYSRSDTLDQLCRLIEKDVVMLAPEADFDDLDSLAAVLSGMPEHPSAAQRQFRLRAEKMLAAADR